MPNGSNFVVPPQLITHLRGVDGSLWRMDHLGEIELDANGDVGRINCTLKRVVT